MDAALLELYKALGFFGMVVAGVSVLIYRGAIAVINRQNAVTRDQLAASAAIETTAQLAKDSTLNLQIRNEAYHTLQTELSNCREIMTASDRDYAACQTQLIRLQQEAQTLRAERATLKKDLHEAQEALLAYNLEVIELKRRHSE